MFNLYQERGFSDYLNDTITFVKQNGKHYFKNYFIICGGVLLLLCVLGYVIMQAYASFIAGSVSGNFDMENVFGGNIFLFGVIFLLFMLVFFLFSILMYLYPVVYLDLYDQNGGNDFTTNQLFDEIKSRIWRGAAFSLYMILFTFTAGILIFAILVGLMITIIGIPVAFIGLFAIMAMIALSYFIYLNNRDFGFMDSLKLSYTHIISRIWPIVGSNFIMMLLVQIIVSMVTLVPMMMSMANIVSSTTADNPDLASTSIMFAATMLLSYILSFILQNLIIINNGMIYYTMKDSYGEYKSKSEIDLIGTDSE